jgi:hypothetical protein
MAEVKEVKFEVVNVSFPEFIIGRIGILLFMVVGNLLLSVFEIIPLGGTILLIPFIVWLCTHVVWYILVPSVRFKQVVVL